MTGRRSSLLGLAALAALTLSWTALAQQPGSQPPGSPPAAPPTAAPTPPTAGTTAPDSGPQAVTQVRVSDLEQVFVQQAVALQAARRFSFNIDAKTPTNELLPKAPAVNPIKGPVLNDDLKSVPEIEFQARPKITPDGKLIEEAAHQLAKINHLNAKKTDAFMTALIESRPDLAGMPFIMGDDCRTSGERSRLFAQAVNTVRQALGGGVAINLGGPMGGGPPNGFSRAATGSSGPGQPGPGGGPMPAPQFLSPPAAPGSMGPFWTAYPALCEQEDAALKRPDKELREHVAVSRIAALMQMLAPESAELRLGLVKYLTAIPHVEATRALAKLAIYSPEDDVRAAAIESLKVRREKDYTDILVKGLRYPWPAVAKRAGEAVAKMGRSDLIPELVAVLSEEDPRMPASKSVDGKKISVVREMVRVNHHRNCMMCHAPRDPVTTAAGALTAEVPIPGQPLPTPFQGYGSSSPDLMIRVDVTYLRQDFSAMLPVPVENPWPDMQRFDFMVRERKLTCDEADEYRTQLALREPGAISPYHKAALAALRDLTGKDTAPTAEAWRKLLKIRTTE
jgi:hypothetical protein